MERKTRCSPVVVRRATWDDLDSFGKLNERPTIKAWCGEVDGRIVGVGGFYLHNGRWVGFCELKDEGRRYKVAFIKAARQAMQDMAEAGHRVIYAEADPNFPMAPRWIESLGFELQETGKYRWQHSGQ